MLIIVTPRDLMRKAHSTEEVNIHDVVSASRNTLDSASHVIYVDGRSIKLLKSRTGDILRYWMVKAALGYCEEVYTEPQQ